MGQEQTQKLKYQLLIEEFMAARGWNDDLEVDAEAQTAALNTGINLGEQSGRLIVQGCDVNDMVDVYVYYEIKCKESKLEQMAQLMNGLHMRWSYGRFEVFPDGYMRWSHRVDFEGSQPSALSIERMVKPGWDAAQKFADVISAVALTKQSASEALSDYDNEQNDNNKNDSGDEVPSEL